MLPNLLLGAVAVLGAYGLGRLNGRSGHIRLKDCPSTLENERLQDECDYWRDAFIRLGKATSSDAVTIVELRAKCETQAGELAKFKRVNGPNGRFVKAPA